MYCQKFSIFCSDGGGLLFAFFLHVNVLSMASANVSPIGTEERRAYGREDAVHKENAYLGEMRSEDSTGSRGALACFIQFFGFKIGLHLSFCFFEFVTFPPL